MLRLAVASAALVAIAVVAAEMLRSGESVRGGIGDRPPALLAIAGDGGDRRLLRLDPSSLRPLPLSVRLDESAQGWAWDPDRRRAVVVTAGAAALRLLDLQRMRMLGTIRVGARGALAAVSWPRSDRIWLVIASARCCARGTTTVVIVDTIRRRVMARRTLAAGLARVTDTPDGPVLLLAPPSGIGLVEVATVDLRGNVDSLRLDDVLAGVQSTEGIVHFRRPAIAVDPHMQISGPPSGSGRYRNRLLPAFGPPRRAVLREPEQRSTRYAVRSAAAPIRPSQQRADGRTSAPRQLLC